LVERAKLQIFDPKVKKKQILCDLKQVMNNVYHGDGMQYNVPESELVDKNVTIESDVFAAAKDSHALVILTEWDEFKEYDYEKIYKIMEKPAFIFDGRRILDHKKLREIGFETYCVGEPIEKLKLFE
jgi:UDPglucose 6-dehydrogenase